jgi:hypothetical protein
MLKPIPQTRVNAKAKPNSLLASNQQWALMPNNGADVVAVVVYAEGMVTLPLSFLGWMLVLDSLFVDSSFSFYSLMQFGQFRRVL